MYENEGRTESWSYRCTLPRLLWQKEASGIPSKSELLRLGKTSWHSIDVCGNDRHIWLFYKNCHNCHLLPFCQSWAVPLMGFNSYVWLCWYTRTGINFFESKKRISSMHPHPNIRSSDINSRVRFECDWSCFAPNPIFKASSQFPLAVFYLRIPSRLSVLFCLYAQSRW